MTTKTTERNHELQDVLEELSMSSASPNAEIIERFVRRYPLFAREITDFAVELALDALHGDEPDEDPVATATVSPGVATAMSRLHNRLHAVRKAVEAPTAKPPHNPFTGLIGGKLTSLKQRIRANSVFVMKLRDRLVDPSTIPAELTRVIADELGVSVAIVQDHWTGPPVIQRASSFKSDRKPETSTRQTFAEAVASSNLSAEQQTYLLAL